MPRCEAGNAIRTHPHLRAASARGGLGRAIAGTLAQRCTITCSLRLARARWPGLPNTLDDVLQRLRIPYRRDLHGALLDAQLLAQAIPHLR